MKRIAVASAASLLALAAHAESPAEFAYRLPLATTGTGAFYRVDIPAAVYEGALRSDLGDARVFNGDGAPVPVAFLAPPAAAREAVSAVALPLFPLRVERDRRDLGDVTLNVRRDATGTTIDLATRDGAAIRGERLAGYLIDASELKSPPTALKLELQDGANVSTRVTVEGSDDLAAWRPLSVASPVLAVEFSGRRLSRDRVDLAPGPAKYLRIAAAAGQPPLELAGVRAEFADRLIDAARQDRKAEGVASGDAGDYVFDLGGAFPIDRIAVELPEQNTVAPAQVYARNDAKDPWRPVGATVFYRLKQDTGETTSPPLPVAAVPARYWKVTVDPRAGGLGSKPPTLVALWIPQTLVFAARGNGPFELAYGSAQAKPATLPIATLVPGFDARATPATFGVATPGTATTPPALAALRQPVDVKRWLLWGALGLATLVLGWMAYALSKQMRLPANGEHGAPSAGATKETAP
ncbi:MAG TPA: DUF3999 domain-containing protein [Casimicrobiaceae bacterium]|nr:DUF3999 domain-containing protein [Casimicrobiaceae bacterium]